MRKGWLSVPLLVMLALSIAMPAWANNELHPGSRLFFPLWDVSTNQRITFIIVTREALNEGQRLHGELAATAGSTTTEKTWHVDGTGNCTMRGKWEPSDDFFGSGEDDTDNVNRTDLGGTSADPVFVDDVHFEYYGKSCKKADEVVHMSCSDIDVFLLASKDNSDGLRPRNQFASVAGDLRGALDVHRIDNGSNDPRDRQKDDSLMGHAVISDLAEGWAAIYPAAAAKSTFCFLCGFIDHGDLVGYEAYPMEVYLPFAFADDFPSPGGTLRNTLSLWSPPLFPGDSMRDEMSLQWKWWDGRERPQTGSDSGHAIVRPLGGNDIGAEVAVDPNFKVSNFVCGHTTDSSKAENDGFPRLQPGSAGTCSPGNLAGGPGPDFAHDSDNFENGGDINSSGHSIQASIPIGWWRFQLIPDNDAPNPFGFFGTHSGRGLVGVNLSTSAAGIKFFAVGDTTRLWHKDPCRIADSGETWGPPHLRDTGVQSAANQLPGFVGTGTLLSLFNVGDFSVQEDICEGDGLINGAGFDGLQMNDVQAAEIAAPDID